MSAQLVRGLLMLAPVCLLIAGAAISFGRARSLFTLLQLLGAASLAVLGLCHIAEALRLLPQIGWGLPHGLGHYIALTGAVVGLTLFPLGYLGDTLTRRGA